MEALQYWHLSFFSAWIFVFLFPSFCSKPRINLESTVFVALSGQPLHITSNLHIPANQSSDMLICFDPFCRQIYNCDVHAKNGQLQILQLELKNLNSSGEYLCKYKTAKVYWFLRVRENGYMTSAAMDDTQFTAFIICSGLLLVFSVVGSVYVVRRHWEERSKKEKQKKGSRKKRETRDDNVHAVTSPAASFYASLETRPRSIYDVLDHTAVNTEPEQRKAKPKKKAPHKKMVQATQPQEENVFECVYENF